MTTSRGDRLHIVASNTITQAEYADEVGTQRKKRTISTLIGQLRLRGVPTPLREQMLVPGRKWRSDLYWPDARLAAEYEGGIATHQRALDPETGRTAMSRHATPNGYRDDCEKYNAIQLAGIIVLRAEVQLVRNEKAADQIAAAYFARVAQMEIEAALVSRYAIERYGPHFMQGMLASFATRPDGEGA